jgi:cytochrome P450
MVFDKWAREHGPIFQVRAGASTIICVNDPRIAKELFEKRGAKYSSRSVPYVAYELLSQKRRIVLTPSGHMHAVFRRQLHAILSISKTKQNLMTPELESRQVLFELIKFSDGLGNPENPPDYEEPQSIIRRYTLSVMMTLSFGHRVNSLHDPIVKTIFDIMDDIAIASQPGQYLVDMFPILKRLPDFLRIWERQTERKIEWQWAFLKNLLMRTEKQMKAGTPNSGLIRALIEQRQGMSQEEKEAEFLDDKSIAYQAPTLMAAGSDTTAIATMNFMLAMVLYSNVMRKGRESVDAVVPASRLPEFDDLTSMPYINQIVKEVMRWRPVLLRGVPHMNTTDDELDGYYIPANSMIIGNMWSMQHDPAHYTNPSELIPERFEKNKGKSAFEFKY